MCDTLFKLISLQYHPGTSLEEHIDSFQRIYASYESINHNSSNQMEILSTIAATFFIRSLNKDRDLSGLLQTLYDITPFDLNTLINCVAVKHCCRGSPVDQALLADKSRPQEQPKPPNHGGLRGKGRGAFKGQRKGNDSSKEEGPLKRLEKLKKALARLQAGTTSSKLNTVSKGNDESGELHQSDCDVYIIGHILSTESWDQDTIYLDSGAGKSVVNDVRYLMNTVKVNKQVNTFSEPVKITHEGTLVFKGIHISPVYFAPKGPLNLLSVSQLVDNGCKPMYKGESSMIMMKNWVINEFVRCGNLFVTRLHQPSVYSTEILGSNKDWHNILGHPSDSYIEHLIQSKKISGSITSLKNFQVCMHAKLKRKPHMKNLPSSNAPSSKIHMDTLEISPPSQQGYRYVLVLVDYFSWFKHIYLMTEKSKSEFHVKAFFNELYNKTKLIPAYIHTDRGGEFDTKAFKRQSKIPICYWDEAAMHASLLLSHLPHKDLKMVSSNDFLKSNQIFIQPMIELKKLVPFGIKVFIKNENTSSKVNPTGISMKALTYEPYSDALRVLDPSNGKIKASQDYIHPRSDTTVILCQKPETLLYSAEICQQRMVSLTLLTDFSEDSDNHFSGHDNTKDHDTPSNNQPVIVPQPLMSESHSKNYEYVPFYQKAPKDVSSQLSEENILESSKRHRRPPDRLMLADVVTYKTAISDPLEKDKW
ncbi:hypothetical protein O181_040219 [Austropuccinia psidii MF-1]|uniref:Integrase catalytic domain-containing protein n=1 Tax=Austropuccinia psidii MF-1 TaxID=1389203 RepID=A0A9Q3DBZ7_9BASI|nr:hypothetical protein [Austropuccinia psidii MF-1]